ncbi:hypothetical protein TYRP_003667 [Tyrophagus putrescentiae]|nr:hypothetical protein TYRP_003667 [Tyrophagus putrescentiae]
MAPGAWQAKLLCTMNALLDRTVLIIANGQLAELVVAIGENHVRLIGGQANFGWRRTRMN